MKLDEVFVVVLVVFRLRINFKLVREKEKKRANNLYFETILLANISPKSRCILLEGR